ncbi:MAG: calcium-translocating P-type ATPase, PMCA-type [Ignavibacteriaceae bacterium]
MNDLNQNPEIDFKGLTSAEVERSRQKHGENIITPPKQKSLLKLFLEKLDDPIIKILIVATIISFAVGLFDGHYVESLGIFTAIILATVISFANEVRAKHEFDILNKTRDEDPVTVIRDGKYLSIGKRDIVVGDYVILEVGEEIPADGIIRKSVSLQINESSLTGESVPVSKFTKAETERMKPKHSTYESYEIKRGTFVTDGNGICEITAVGDNTDIGKTARAAAEETGRKTPLTIQLEKLSKLIGSVGFSMAVLTFMILIGRALVKGELLLNFEQKFALSIVAISTIILTWKVWLPFVYDLLEVLKIRKSHPEFLGKNGLLHWGMSIIISAIFAVAAMLVAVQSGIITSNYGEWLSAAIIEKVLSFFMISVTMIVVAIPEGLAMAVTLSLAYSVRKMTKLNNLVRKMHAVETISAATVICSDKTGTLTRNEMRVKEYSFPSVPDNFLESDDKNDPKYFLIEAITANSTANLSDEKEKKERVLGNPTEGALLLWLEQHYVDYHKHRNAFNVEYQWTFNTERKYMATLGKSAIKSSRILHIKGAPEIILAKCSKVKCSEGKIIDISERRDKIKEMLKKNQERALRTIAMAYYEDPQFSDEMDLEKLGESFTWLGMFSIEDPVRLEVPQAILDCRNAGVEVKIVTGDTYITAREVGKQINLFENDLVGETDIVLGNDFREMDDETAYLKAGELKVLSRAKPLDKLRLVKFLQKSGHVVAVTGDGINDAPALNYADVGLAMGKTGTSVAKEASDIILLDDSFKSIVNAILFGRSLYLNIQRFLLFQLTINVLALSIVFFGPFIGVELMLTVIQMIWVNLIMDTFAALALATQPPDKEVMTHKPRKSTDFIIPANMGKLIFVYAAIFFVVLIGAMLYFNHTEGEVSDRELTLFFNGFVFLQLWNLFNVRVYGTKHSIFNNLTTWKGTSENKSAGIVNNYAFLLICGIIFLMQILITQFGGKFFRTVPLNPGEWGIVLGGSLIVVAISHFLTLKWSRV